MKHNRAKKRSQEKRVQEEKSEVKQDEDDLHLPRDILIDILVRLPAKYLARCRLVCKSWNSLTHDPEFVNAYHREKSVNKSIISLKSKIRRNKSKNRKVPSLAKLDSLGRLTDEFTMAKLPSGHYYLSNFVNGLTCLCGKSSSYLLNPETQEMVKLPKSPNKIIGLGFNTYTSEYKVVRWSEYEDVWEILTFGSNNPRTIEQTNYFKADFHSVFLHGALHWMVVEADEDEDEDEDEPTMAADENESASGILFLDVNDEKFGFFPIPAECRRSQLRRSQLPCSQLCGGTIAAQYFQHALISCGNALISCGTDIS